MSMPLATATSASPRKRRGSGRLKGLHIRLPEDLIAAAREAAAARRVPLTALYEAALRSYLSPGAQDQRDAMLARPLNRLSRATEGVEWNTKLLIAMVGYLTELNLAYSPEAITEEERDAVESKRIRRFAKFEQWLVRDLIDPENLYNRLQSTVSPSEQDFIDSPPA